MTSIKAKLTLVRELSKSGIVALVLISVLGGFLAGQPFERPLEWSRLALTLLGILLLASGSSALNQYQERHIDATMPRTQKRPLPSGRITEAGAIAFIIFTLIAGLIILTRVDIYLLALGALAVVSYNGLYTLWWKKHWAYAAIPGAVPGALPILMGYVAADGHLGAPGGWYLFAILFFWQMPHFWVLAIRFREDYRSGGIPTLPVAIGAQPTVRQIVIWCLGYCALSLLAPVFLPVHSPYLICALAMSAKLLWELRFFASNPAGIEDPQSKHWLRFFLWINLSLIVYIGAAVADMWSIYLIPYLTR